MNENPSSVDYKALLRGPAMRVAEYIDGHIAALSMNTPTKKGYLIQSAKGGVFLDLGFTQKTVGSSLIDIPTVFNIQLGDMSSRGHGPKIVTLWENGFPSFNCFGANVVLNPGFWSHMGYQRYENMFWLKRR